MEINGWRSLQFFRAQVDGGLWRAAVSQTSRSTSAGPTCCGWPRTTQPRSGSVVHGWSYSVTLRCFREHGGFPRLSEPGIWAQSSDSNARLHRKPFGKTKSPKLNLDPFRTMNASESKNVVSAGAHRRNLAEYVVQRMARRSLFDYTVCVLISRWVSNGRLCAACWTKRASRISATPIPRPPICLRPPRAIARSHAPRVCELGQSRFLITP